MIDKKDELIGVMQEYIDFLSKCESDMFPIAYIHGVKYKQEDILKGKHFRERISLLKLQTNPNNP